MRIVIEGRIYPVTSQSYIERGDMLIATVGVTSGIGKKLLEIVRNKKDERDLVYITCEAGYHNAESIKVRDNEINVIFKRKSFEKISIFTNRRTGDKRCVKYFAWKNLSDAIASLYDNGEANKIIDKYKIFDNAVKEIMRLAYEKIGEREDWSFCETTLYVVE